MLCGTVLWCCSCCYGGAYWGIGGTFLLFLVLLLRCMVFYVVVVVEILGCVCYVSAVVFVVICTTLHIDWFLICSILSSRREYDVVRSY